MSTVWNPLKGSNGKELEVRAALDITVRDASGIEKRTLIQGWTTLHEMQLPDGKDYRVHVEPTKIDGVAVSGSNYQNINLPSTRWLLSNSRVVNSKHKNHLGLAFELSFRNGCMKFLLPIDSEYTESQGSIFFNALQYANDNHRITA